LQLRLMPGESTTMNCMVDANGHRDQLMAGVTVLYCSANDEQNVRSIRCLLRAHVNPVVRTSAAELRFMIGKSGTQRVAISSYEVTKVAVVSAVSEHPAFTTSVSRDRTAVEVSFDASKWFENEGVVPIRLTTSYKPEERIAIRARVLAAGQ